MKPNKRKLREEVKQAILADCCIIEILADANEKTQKTIENWIKSDAIQLTAEANIEIICNRFSLEKENIFAIEIPVSTEL